MTDLEGVSTKSWGHTKNVKHGYFQLTMGFCVHFPSISTTSIGITNKIELFSLLDSLKAYCERKYIFPVSNKPFV